MSSSWVFLSCMIKGPVSFVVGHRVLLVLVRLGIFRLAIISHVSISYAVSDCREKTICNFRTLILLWEALCLLLDGEDAIYVLGIKLCPTFYVKWGSLRYGHLYDLSSTSLRDTKVFLLMMCFVLQHGGTSVASLEIIGSGVLVQVNGKMYPRSTCVHLRGGDEVVFSNPGKHSYVSFYHCSGKLFIFFSVFSLTICELLAISAQWLSYCFFFDECKDIPTS